MLAYRTPRYDRPQSCRSYRAHDRRYAARGNPSKCRAYQRHDMRHETPIVPPYRPFSLLGEKGDGTRGGTGHREATLSDSPDLASEILENLELNRKPHGLAEPAYREASSRPPCGSSTRRSEPTPPGGRLPAERGCARQSGFPPSKTKERANDDVTAVATHEEPPCSERDALAEQRAPSHVQRPAFGQPHSEKVSPTSLPMADASRLGTRAAILSAMRRLPAMQTDQRRARCRRRDATRKRDGRDASWTDGRHARAGDGHARVGRSALDSSTRCTPMAHSRPSFCEPTRCRPRCSPSSSAAASRRSGSSMCTSIPAVKRSSGQSQPNGRREG